MNTLPNINQVDISSDNISKILESQKKLLKQDILYFKEDILKDFRQIENKLNNKYDQQNSNVVKHLENFENYIKTMNNKISQLSNLITTDKNIEEKITKLYEFKAKIDDDLLSHNLAIKNISKELKNAINNYDNLFSNSIIYPETIGPNRKFATFHDLIDYILLNITQLSNFKDKNNLDFKSYKTKLEQLVKSFKIQAESIIMNNAEFTNKRISDTETKFQDLLGNQDSKIFELKFEINKLNTSIEKKLNNEKEIDFFNKFLKNKFENFQNEFKIIKNKFKSLDNFLNKLRMSMSGEFKLEKDESEDFNKKSKRMSQLLVNGISAKSIIKKYIMGEMDVKDIKFPIKKQKSIVNFSNEFKNNLLFHQKHLNNSFYQLSKRMTFGPDKFRSIQKLEKVFVNNHKENSLFSDKIVNQINNSLSEEKDDNFDYLKSYKSKKFEYKNSSRKESYNNLITENIKENENENEFSSLYEEIDNENNPDKKLLKNKVVSTIEKQKNKKEKKISFDDNSKQSYEQMEKKSGKNKNLKDKNIINNIIKFEEVKNNHKEIKDNLKNISYEKLDINNKSFPKISTSINSERVTSKNIINTQSQLIADEEKLCKMKGRCLSHYKNFNNPQNKYYNFKRIGLINKLNIIEMNFDEVNPLIKEKEEIKKIKNVIKENGTIIMPEKNKEKNKVIKKNKIYKRNSDANYQNNSLGKIIINNMGNNYYYNMQFKNDSQNYSTIDYLNSIQRNKIGFNTKKISLKKHK